MTAVWISKDELWPDYRPHEHGELTLEVDAEDLERWRRVIAAYDAVQGEIQALVDAAYPPRRWNPATGHWEDVRPLL